MGGAGRRHLGGPGSAGWAALLLTLLLASACSTPVGVKRVDAQRVHRALTANVLTSGEPSAPADQALHRDDLSTLYEKDPAAALAELRARWLADPGPRRLFALAELSFAHAEKGGGRPYYLAAAVYAYAYLFAGAPGEAPDCFDPRFRLAADLYNRGFTAGLLGADDEFVDLAPRVLPLPFGELVLEADAAEFLWVNHHLDNFVPVAELQVRGLSSRYRRRGIGVPLAAHVGPIAEGRSADTYEKWLPPRARVAATAVVRLDDVRAGIASGHVRGRVELFPGSEHESVEIAGREVPLEYEPTAAIAYSLEKSRIWDIELSGFMGRPVVLEAKSNLVMLAPHQRGRIPVVLVHGTASSPARWVEMINELSNDPRLSSRIEFWLFFYNTGNPILYSGMQLRGDLRDAIASLDPQGTDPGIQRMVVIGHSQGGLLTKLQAVDSGDHFWRLVSDKPISAMGLDPETEKLFQKAFFFRAVPQVRDVVFICTPHGGSFLATYRLASALGRLVRLPGNIVKAGIELLENNELHSELDRLPSSIDNMRPGSPFLVTLHDLPLARGVSGHSIIAVRSPGPILGQSDGVVSYESAHLEGMASEKIVISPHAGAQDHPDTIAEVRRILLEHLAAP